MSTSVSHGGATDGVKRRFVRTLVLALATSTVVAGLAAAPASATASWGCGRLVTGSITLSSDMIDCPRDGLVIGASKITINLNGHVLSGVGAGKGISNRDGFDEITITNGRIENFEIGAYFIDSSYSTITKITFTGLNGVMVSGDRRSRTASSRTSSTGPAPRRGSACGSTDTRPRWRTTP